ncbi:MAG: hypothetical protein BHV77_11405 [Bacteroides sp. 43_108]|nr:MAG: hypothetical protein BHV77_11405 [Bacteroides sp. 43_108]
MPIINISPFKDNFLFYFSIWNKRERTRYQNCIWRMIHYNEAVLKAIKENTIHSEQNLPQTNSIVYVYYKAINNLLNK